MRKFYSLLFAALAVVAMAQVFTSCEKDDYEVQIPDAQIIFTTNKNIGETIQLAVSLSDEVPEIDGAVVKSVEDWEPYPRMLICELTSQTVTVNGEIKWFWCDDCGVTSITTSLQPTLQTLSCNNNLLTTINVSNNVELRDLSCGGNQLTKLDVSKNTKLTHLVCHYNELTSLDLTNNPKIESLILMQNKIKAAEMSKIINTLPDWTGKESIPWEYIEDHGVLYILSGENGEENEILEEDKKIAEAKNWRIYRAQFKHPQSADWGIFFVYGNEASASIFGV